MDYWYLLIEKLRTLIPGTVIAKELPGGKWGIERRLRIPSKGEKMATGLLVRKFACKK